MLIEGELNAACEENARGCIFTKLHPQTSNRILTLSDEPFKDLESWAPVGDDLPDVDISVLTYNEDPDDHNVAYYDDEAGTFWNDYGDEIFASHWQHLTTPND